MDSCTTEYVIFPEYITFSRDQICLLVMSAVFTLPVFSCNLPLYLLRTHRLQSTGSLCELYKLPSEDISVDLTFNNACFKIILSDTG